MPFIQIYSNEEIYIKDKFIDTLKEVSAKSFTCKESEIHKHDFSITHTVDKTAQLAGNAGIEIRIMAHNFKSRLKNLDQITASIQSTMQGAPWGMVKVFVFLLPIGMK